MNRSRRLIAAALLMWASPTFGSPADALKIQNNWQAAVEQWSMEVRAANTPEARAKAWAARRDVTPYAKQMWTVIGPALGEEWTLEPAAWFVRAASPLVVTAANGSTTPAFGKEIEALRQAVETRHMKSAKLTALCMALASYQDPRSLALLEKIQAKHADKKVQGVAALAAATMLKALGDDKELARKRLTYLRKAIIQSAEVDVGNGVTVAKLAEDEIYIITYLAKGRIAPDLEGIDAAGKAFKLSDYSGKVVVLLFWNSTMIEAQRVVEITAAMAKKFDNRPFVVLGVNPDPLEKLRAFEADGTIPWRNFSDPSDKLAAIYRVGVRPVVYVLDGQRKIHFAGVPGSFAELTAEALLAEAR